MTADEPMEFTPEGTLIESRTTPPVPSLDAARHRLLMPPHPGDVYLSSALCSCGQWQYDADVPSSLFDAYRDILRDHTEHAALDRADVPAAPEKERRALAPGSPAWRIATAVREVVIHGVRDRFPGGYDLVWYVEQELAALAVQPADRADVVDERLATLDRERLADLIHGSDCTCPYQAELADLALADRLLASGVRIVALDRADVVDERLDFRDELVGLEHEIAAFLHPMLWSGPHDIEPGDGSDCHECYARAERLIADLASKATGDRQ